HSYNDRSGARQVCVVNLQARVFERHHCRGIGELGMTCHSLGLKFWLDIFKRIKILHFARDLAFQIAGVEKRDWANAATALEKRIPECFQSDPVGGENPHPGDDDAVSLNHSGYQPSKHRLRPKVSLDESRKKLALKADETPASIKKPNSNVPTKCSHYISFPLPNCTYSQFFTYSQDRSCAPSVFV